MASDTSPNYILKFETGAATHVGKVRSANEDSLVVRPELGLWAVADGVGGHEAGQFASQTVVIDLGSIGPAVSQADQMARFKDRILRANDKVLHVREERDGVLIGTTVAALLIYDETFTCAWMGDSRIYRIRDGRIEQLSRDHTEARELVEQGILTPEEARTWPRRNVITRAIGIFDEPEVEEEHGTIEPGDTFLICSDGLTGHISDDEITKMVENKRAQDACDDLIEETLARGATDNVTVIVVNSHRAERTNFVPGGQGDGAGVAT